MDWHVALIRDVCDIFCDRCFAVLFIQFLHTDVVFEFFLELELLARSSS
jgi:hypothetical protein